MKKLFLPLAAIAILVALYEQSKEHPNVYVMCAAVVVFMIGVINLSSKIKSKNNQDTGHDSQERR